MYGKEANQGGKVFFSGTVQEAICACRRQQCPLVVFLKGGDSLSQAAETSIHLALQTENCRCIALRLHDDLTDTDPDSYRGAKAFRDIFPSIDALPFFMALGPDGKEIARLEGEDIRIQLAETMRLATGSHAGSTEVEQQALEEPEELHERKASLSRPMASLDDGDLEAASSASSNASTTEANLALEPPPAPPLQRADSPMVETPTSFAEAGSRAPPHPPQETFVTVGRDWPSDSGSQPQSQVADIGSSLLAASEQAAQIAAFHQRNSAWNQKFGSQPPQGGMNSRPGFMSDTNSPFNSGSLSRLDWKGYFSNTDPPGQSTPASPARSASQGSVHSHPRSPFSHGPRPTSPTWPGHSSNSRPWSADVAPSGPLQERRDITSPGSLGEGSAQQQGQFSDTTPLGVPGNKAGDDASSGSRPMDPAVNAVQQDTSAPLPHSKDWLPDSSQQASFPSSYMGPGNAEGAEQAFSGPQAQGQMSNHTGGTTVPEGGSNRDVAGDQHSLGSVQEASPFRSPSSQGARGGDQSEAIQGLKAAIQHNLETLEDSSAASLAAAPPGGREQTQGTGTLGHDIVSFGSLSEALPEHDPSDSSPPEPADGLEGQATDRNTQPEPASLPDNTSTHPSNNHQEGRGRGAPGAVFPFSSGRSAAQPGSRRPAGALMQGADDSSLRSQDENIPPQGARHQIHREPEKAESSQHLGYGLQPGEVSHASHLGLPAAPELPAMDKHQQPGSGGHPSLFNGYVNQQHPFVGLPSADSHPGEHNRFGKPPGSEGTLSGGALRYRSQQYSESRPPPVVLPRQDQESPQQNDALEDGMTQDGEASPAERAREKASEAAFKEALNYNRRYGPSKGSDALRAQEVPAAMAALRAKEGAGNGGLGSSSGQERGAGTLPTGAQDQPSSRDGAGDSRTQGANIGPSIDTSLLPGRKDLELPHKKADTEGASKPVTNDQGSSSPQPIGVTKISFRLTNGTVLRREFPATTTLRTAKSFLDRKRSDGRLPYLLRTPFPYRLLDSSHHDSTLQDLDLCPRSVLVLQPMEENKILAMGQQGLQACMDYIHWYFVSLAALFLGFFSGMFGSNEEQVRRSANPAARTPPPQRTTAKEPLSSEAWRDATSFKGGAIKNRNSPRTADHRPLGLSAAEASPYKGGTVFGGSSPRSQKRDNDGIQHSGAGDPSSN